jgi:hypothetical protein
LIGLIIRARVGSGHKWGVQGERTMSIGNCGTQTCATGIGRLRIIRVLAATVLLALPIHVSVAAAQSLTHQTPEPAAENTIPDGTLDAGVLALAKAMQIDQIIAVMREEGLDYAKTLQEDMFPGAGNSGWIAEVEGIYDAARMQKEFTAALSVSLAGNAGLPAMSGFMGGDFGNRVVGLELAARKALLDPAAEDAARVAWLKLEEEDGTRARAIQRLSLIHI